MTLPVIKFMGHYEGNGWMIGKVKVKDWKACVRTWCADELAEKKRKEEEAKAQQSRVEAVAKEPVVPPTPEQRRHLHEEFLRVTGQLKPRGIGFSKRVQEDRKQRILRELESPPAQPRMPSRADLNKIVADPKDILSRPPLYEGDEFDEFIKGD